MLALLFFAAVGFAARAASARVWRLAPAGEEPGPCERAASVALAAFAIAVAVDWTLALAHLFTRAALLVATAGLAAAAWRAGAFSLRGARWPRLPAIVLVAFVPAALWAVYAALRGAIVYPWVSDALSYHLPKAVLVATSHTYAAFDGPDARLTTFPADFEMLLADFLALDGGHRLTMTIGAFALVSIGLTVAGMAERWWGRGAIHTSLAALLTLGMPAVVLGTGALKNDVLLAAVVLAAAHFGARWAACGDRAALVFAIAATGLAIGTKVSGGMLLPALLPCAVIAWRRRAARAAGDRATLREIGAWLAGAVLAVLLLGGAAYVANIVAIGRPVGAIPQNGYGDWKVLWMFPILVWIRGFCGDETVWVPWKGEHWFWPQYDLWYGTWGPVTSLLLIALPFAIARRPRDDRATERGLASIAIAIAFFEVLPLRYQQPPVGLFEADVRYTLFLPPVVFLWTIVRWARERGAEALSRRRVLGVVLLAGVALGYQVVRCTVDDTFVPIERVVAVVRGELGKDYVQSWSVRAESWIDAHAGPDDVVAIDGAFDTWSYPAYGRDLRRRVVFLHGGGAPVAIPDDARWVAVDRSWNVVFGAPGFLDYGTYYRDTLCGKPLPEDLAVFGQLLGDPRFRLVYRDLHANQAVFERVAP